MKLYWKIILVSLLPLVVALGLGFLNLEGLLGFQRSAREASDELKMTVLRSRLRDFREDRRRKAHILAGASDTESAVQERDTHYLVERGKLFLDPLRASRILFVDADGVVLGRAHAPACFGDDLGGHPAFALALRGVEDNGFFELDGELLLLRVAPVRQYGERIIGAVGIGALVTPELLAYFVEGAGIGIEWEVEGFPAISSGPHDGTKRTVEFAPRFAETSLPMRRFAAVFMEDEIAQNLEAFRKNLLRTLLVLVVLLPTGLLLLLRRYLRPFSLLVEDLTLLSGTREDFFELRGKLAHNYPDGNHEVSVVARAISRLMERVQETITLLEWTSRTDPLTRISNRLHLDSVLEHEMDACAKTGAPLSVLIFDLDRFKTVNDDFGHQAGDRVLRRTAELLKSLLPVGFVGRWGGEEFLAVLPGADEEEALEFGERLREAVATEPFSIGRRVTISGGVARMVAGDTPGSLVGRADKGLYEAKASGRNRVTLRKA